MLYYHWSLSSYSNHMYADLSPINNFPKSHMYNKTEETVCEFYPNHSFTMYFLNFSMPTFSKLAWIKHLKKLLSEMESLKKILCSHWNAFYSTNIHNTLILKAVSYDPSNKGIADTTQNVTCSLHFLFTGWGLTYVWSVCVEFPSLVVFKITASWHSKLYLL